MHFDMKKMARIGGAMATGIGNHFKLVEDDFQKQ